VRLRVLGHADMAPGTAWEMWLLPGGGEKPVSLGLITTHETQTMVVPAALAQRLDNAEGLAMSVSRREARRPANPPVPCSTPAGRWEPETPQSCDRTRSMSAQMACAASRMRGVWRLMRSGATLKTRPLRTARR